MLGKLVKNVRIEGIDARGNAFGRIPGGTVLVDKAIPGDVADIQALRISKGEDALFSGRIIDMVEPSADRITPFCKHFMHCGGCQWQPLSYSNQILLKHRQVAQLFDRHLPEGQSTPLPIASPLEKKYRNKLLFNFSNRRWMTPEEKSDPATVFRPAAGYMMQGKYDHALEIHDCGIAPDSAIAIMHAVRDTALAHKISFYDMRKEQGILRQLMVRYGDEGAIMTRIVFGKFDDSALQVITQLLTDKFPAVQSISYSINIKKDGKLNEADTIIAHGSSTIPITLNGLQFEMSPGSFFQTNTLQTEQLYKTAIDWCELTGQQTVYDLYSGTGTIALSAANASKRVVGIEFVEDAVRWAKKNAKNNNITNAEFVAGDLKDIILSDRISALGLPDVVITDPPRSGHHRDVNQALLKLLPSRIVYISCNPRTQERDVRILSSHYRLERIQPFDMFPHTGHVENVALLLRVNA